MNDVGGKIRLRLLFQEVDLQDGEYVIGRSHACNLTIDDPRVSREHSKITVSVGKAFIEDLDSRNGTVVNGRFINGERRLADGDRVRIGDYEFVFLAEKGDLSTERPTLRTLSCPGCNCLVPEESKTCANCGVDLSPTADVLPSASKQTKLATESSVRRRSAMISEVINLALSMEHFDKAGNLLDAKIAEFERGGLNEETDVQTLVDLSEINLLLAGRLNDGSRVAWVFEAWMQTGLEMPEEVIISIEKAALGWMPLRYEAEKYLDHIRTLPPDRMPSSDFVERLRAMA